MLGFLIPDRTSLKTDHFSWSLKLVVCTARGVGGWGLDLLQVGGRKLFVPGEKTNVVTEPKKPNIYFLFLTGKGEMER